MRWAAVEIGMRDVTATPRAPAGARRRVAWMVFCSDAQHFRHALAGGAGQQVDRAAGGLAQGGQPSGGLPRGHRIGLVQADDFGLVRQAAAIGSHLAANRAPGLHDIARRRRRSGAAARRSARHGRGSGRRGRRPRARPRSGRECRPARILRTSDRRMTPSCGCRVVNG